MVIHEAHNEIYCIQKALLHEGRNIQYSWCMDARQ